VEVSTCPHPHAQRERSSSEIEDWLQSKEEALHAHVQQ
jgi:hypothetical protein